MKRYTIKFTDADHVCRNIDIFAKDDASALDQLEANFPGYHKGEILSSSDITPEELEGLENTGGPSPKKKDNRSMSIEDVISNLMEFAPNVLGVCPECGRALVFDGWKCFECGFDPNDMTGDQKFRALKGWARLTGELKTFSGAKQDAK